MNPFCNIDSLCGESTGPRPASLHRVSVDNNARLDVCSVLLCNNQLAKQQPLFQCKDHLSMYMDFHYENKTVLRPLCLDSGNLFNSHCCIHMFKIWSGCLGGCFNFQYKDYLPMYWGILTVKIRWSQDCLSSLMEIYILVRLRLHVLLGFDYLFWLASELWYGSTPMGWQWSWWLYFGPLITFTNGWSLITRKDWWKWWD